MPQRHLALRAMAAYYLATGLWPIVDIRSFEAVTGPKTDRWLVKTVGLLAAAIGATFAAGATRRTLARETLVLVAASAAAFTAIDVVYTARGRIRPIYLGDAACEIALAAAVLLGDR